MPPFVPKRGWKTRTSPFSLLNSRDGKREKEKKKRVPLSPLIVKDKRKKRRGNSPHSFWVRDDTHRGKKKKEKKRESLITAPHQQKRD